MSETAQQCGDPRAGCGRRADQRRARLPADPRAISRETLRRAPTSPVQGECHQRVYARLPTRYARALHKELPRWPLPRIKSGVASAAFAESR